MKLAVFFPGIGYHCDKPLLYYTRELVREYGYDQIINLNYFCEAQNIRGDEKKIREAGEILYRQTEAQLASIDFDDYEEILFVSKSIGTAVAAAYVMRHNIKCKNIWYTPLVQTFEFDPHDGIVFTGTHDPWCPKDVVKNLCVKAQIPCFEYERANHSLEVAAVNDNLQILQQIMEQSLQYIRHYIGTSV